MPSRPERQGPLGAALTKLRQRVHRREPRNRVKTLAAAKRLLQELKLMTLTEDPDLPSLFGAVQGRPAKPRAGGFGRWPAAAPSGALAGRPADAWWWGSALADQPWVLEAKLLAGKSLFVHEDLWPALDGYVRSLFFQLRRGLLKPPPLERKILDTLHQEGPTRTDVLRGLLGMSAKPQGRAFHAAKKSLESLGLVVGQDLPEVDGHSHVSRLSLWIQRFDRRLSKKMAPYQGLAEFFRAVVHAAVVVPRRSFHRRWRWPAEDVERAMEILVSGGSVLMVGLAGGNGYATPERLEAVLQKASTQT